MKNIDAKQANQAIHLSQLRGMGMIEVLITIVILAIGLLGVASLQLIGTFANKEALARTQAVMVAEQMTERLRASAVASNISNGFVVNNSYFDAGNYNFNKLSCTGSKPLYECHCLNIPADIQNCQVNICDPSDLAVFDAYQMSCSMVRENPNATLLVSCDDTDSSDADSCTAGSIHNIMVKWPSQTLHNNFKVSNSNCNLSNTSEFQCLVKRVTL